MFKTKNAYLLLPVLASISFILMGQAGADLTKYQILQLCEGKYMEILSYPSEPSKFIICLNENTRVGKCRTEKDAANNDVQTCFSQQKQTCSLDLCPEARPQTEYDKFIEDYCKNDVNLFQRLPAEDCEHFYVCLGSSNSPVHEACPDGLHFSRLHKVCMTPTEANCQTLDSVCKNKDTGYRFASTNCYDYYECQRSKPAARSCPYGEHFDLVTKKCIPAASSKCTDKTHRIPKCSTKNSGLYFQHPKCDRFFVCVNTVALEGQCPHEFFFDVTAQVCKKDTKGVCHA